MSSLFLYTATIHVLMVVFTLTRIAVKRASADESREAYVAVPQASTAALDLDPRGPEHGQPRAA
jgi:hypothetical protein